MINPVATRLEVLMLAVCDEEITAVELGVLMLLVATAFIVCNEELSAAALELLVAVSVGFVSATDELDELL